MSETSTRNAVPAAKPQTGVSKPTRTIKDWIESDAFKAQIARALPKHLTPDRFLRVALTATLRTPKLLECTVESITSCLLQCSQLGLEPDGRRAHLIPFEDKRNNRVICTLIPDYKGLVELAMRSGLVSHLHADVVREGDLFSYSLGEITTHVPWFLRRDNGRPEEAGADIAVYAYARMRDGASAVAVMSVDEVYAIRDNSQGWQAFQKGFTKSSPWDPENWVSEQEMKKKTALRRLTKILPLSPEFRDAVDVDDEPPVAEVNVTPTGSVGESDGPAPGAPTFKRRKGNREAAPETNAGTAGGNDDPNGEPVPSAGSSSGESGEPVTPAQAPAAATPATPATPAAVVPDVATDPHGFIQFKLEQYGVRFDDFRDWLKSAGHFEQADSMADINDLPKAIAVRITDNGCAFLKKCCRIHGTKEVTTEGGAK